VRDTIDIPEGATKLVVASDDFGELATVYVHGRKLTLEQQTRMQKDLVEVILGVRFVPSY
jgi:hypothetical protein